MLKYTWVNNMKIYVIRHGETNANKEGVLQGASNWPLNDFGIKLAEITGNNMRNIKFDACFSSPLDRAKQTAQIILKNSGNEDVEIQYDKRIQELNMGIYEGKKIEPGQKEVSVIKLLLFKYNAFLCGRFKGGETARELCKRTQEFLKELSTKNYETVLVSTHGCAMRAMLNMLYDNKFNFWQGMVPFNCAVNVIEVKDGEMKLVEKDIVFYDDKYKVDRYNFNRKGELKDKQS